MIKIKKNIIFLILTVSMMMIIFLFSNQNGNISYGQSQIFERIFKKLNFNIPLIHNSLAYTVRKYAHVFLYFILGIFTSLVSYSMLNKSISRFKNIKVFLISFTVCFIYACTDEYHQTFIDGRTGKFSDVLVDTIGFLFAILLIILFKMFHGILHKKSIKK